MKEVSVVRESDRETLEESKLSLCIGLLPSSGHFMLGRLSDLVRFLLLPCFGIFGALTFLGNDFMYSSLWDTVSRLIKLTQM